MQGNAVLKLDHTKWEIVLPAASFGFGIFDAMRGSTGRLLVTDPSAGGWQAFSDDSARPGLRPPPAQLDPQLVCGPDRLTQSEKK